MLRRKLTFRQLETFAAVARSRSFSRAAVQLHLTQPAVSIQVRQVAEAVGMPLFEQIGREISLTPAGEALQAAVRGIDDVWNRFDSTLAEIRGMRRGRLRVGLVTTAKYFLPRMLGDFCRRYPEVEIELEIGNRARILERMRGNEDDLYVMSYPPADLDVVVNPFLDNEHVVVAAQGHWAVGGRHALPDLAGESFLLREPGSGSRHAIDKFLLQQGIELRVRLALGSNEAIRDLAASGMGLAVLSRHVLGADPGRYGLAVLDVAGFPLPHAWHVVHLAGKVLSLPAQAFLDELLRLRAAAAASGSELV
ncbi:LysR family transcriptional regulator [Dechloromonas sp. ZY10]|uniref:LysR family transcriptional regulator n=1 Tax=Dechloromonas aquae TaxID=2664436 RepID=UPI003527D4E1